MCVCIASKLSKTIDNIFYYIISQIMQRGMPYDDISRWRVFKDVKNIDIVRIFFIFSVCILFS